MCMAGPTDRTWRMASNRRHWPPRRVSCHRLRKSCSWPHCSRQCGRTTRSRTGKRYARSPSTRLTKRKRFAGTCRRTNISSSSWWSEAGPIGSNRRAARESAAMCSSSPATTTEATNSSRMIWRRASSCRSTRWSAFRAAARVPGLFSQLKEVYLFGCNTLNADANKRASAEIGRGLVALRTLAGRRRTAVARVERSPWRKQPRPDASDLQGCAGDLWLFVGRAARTDGRFPPAAPLSSRGIRRNRKRPREWTSARRLRRALDGRRDRIERAGSAGRASAGRLSILRRPTAAGAEARLHPSAPGARHGGGPHVPGPHREIRGVAPRRRAAGGGGRGRARAHRARRFRAYPVPRVRARRRPDCGARPDAGAGARPGLAHTERAAGRNRTDGW